MSGGITRRQEQIFDFVVAELREGRRTPTLDEICEHVGLKSRSSAHYLIARMIEAGRLRRAGVRDLEIVGGAEDHLRAVLAAIESPHAATSLAVRRAREYLNPTPRAVADRRRLPFPAGHIPYAGAEA